MCKLTIAQPKGDAICFEIDVITAVVLCLKNTFEKVRVPELIKKTNLFGYSEKICRLYFLYTILKLKIFFALVTSYIIINDDIFMMTLHNVPVFQK